jgi:hypothetical protein
MLVYLLFTSGVGTDKTFTTKAILQILIQIYDAHNIVDYLKPKGLILTYT